MAKESKKDKQKIFWASIDGDRFSCGICAEGDKITFDADEEVFLQARIDDMHDAHQLWQYAKHYYMGRRWPGSNELPF